MSANKPPVYRHERGAEFTSPAAWKNFTDISIEMLAGIILTTATGRAERSMYGSATIGYDETTVILLGAAVSLIRDALKHSSGKWLGHAEETQARLPAARSDQQFQSFLTGTVHDMAQAKTGHSKAEKKGGAA